jgi:hypothetical protein
MRTFASVCAVALLLTCSGASAQSDAQSKRPSKGVGTRAIGQHDQDLRARVDAWYKDCRSSWEATTHMSKRDYDRTCQRMARERIKYLSEQEKAGKRTQ